MIDYAGVSPTLVADTSALQSTEKLSKKGNKLFKNRDGVCMAMVIDWIQKCHEIPGGVTSASQLKSGLALSLAQTAYMRHVFDDDSSDHANDLGYATSQGLNASTPKTYKKTFFSTKKGRLQKVAMACCGYTGYARISIRGNGGHALGFRNSGGVQFFDPNEGILAFNSTNDFAKWFPSYVINEYPTLTERVLFSKVKG